MALKIQTFEKSGVFYAEEVNRHKKPRVMNSGCLDWLVGVKR